MNFIFCIIALIYFMKGNTMKVRSSLKSAKTRDKNCKLVRRRGHVYVINKTNPKYKAKQG